MGIRTRFNPLGGVNVSSEPSGDLSEWRYSTGSDGKITLYEYLGQDTAIDVPTQNTVINCYYSGVSIGNIPFYNNQNIVSVDLNNVPFVYNSMYYAFYNCENLENVKKISNSVTNMDYAFYNCFNLINAPVIPNSVTDMYRTFYGCQNIINAPVIPNSVTNMCYTFYDCRNIIDSPVIPNSVTDMRYTFYGCSNLAGNVIIYSDKVKNAVDTFGIRNGFVKNIYIPYRYINNALTTTRNSFNSAGYVVGTGVGNATINNCVMYDYIAKNYPTYSGNGTHWILSAYGGTNTRVVVPREYTTYATFPTAINVACFMANTTITSVDCSNVGFVGTSLASAFLGCSSLTSVFNINTESITSLLNTFSGASSLRELPYFDNSSAITSMPGCFRNVPIIDTYARVNTSYALPDSVSNLFATFINCKASAFANLYIGSKASNVHSMFKSLTNLEGCNITIFSPSISNITNFFYGYTKTDAKNLHMYFTYSNGKATTTYSKFNGSAMYRNNSTSNFYMYDISGKLGKTPDYIVTNNFNIDGIEYASNSNELYLYKYIGHSANITIPNVLNTGLYPDIHQNYSIVATSNAFVDDYKSPICNYIRNIDFNNVPFINNHIELSGALPNIVTINNISNTITDLSYAFTSCYNLSGNCFIYSQNITNATRCFDNLTNSTLNVYFPFKYENGEYTKTYNAFMNQTYTGITYKDLQGV